MTVMLTVGKFPAPGHALKEVPYVHWPIVVGKRGPDYESTFSNYQHKLNPELSPAGNKKRTSQKCRSLSYITSFLVVLTEESFWFTLIYLTKDKVVHQSKLRRFNKNIIFNHPRLHVLTSYKENHLHIDLAIMPQYVCYYARPRRIGWKSFPWRNKYDFRALDRSQVTTKFLPPHRSQGPPSYHQTMLRKCNQPLHVKWQIQIMAGKHSNNQQIIIFIFH
jgi:hypothetical protein